MYDTYYSIYLEKLNIGYITTLWARVFVLRKGQPNKNKSFKTYDEALAWLETFKPDKIYENDVKGVTNRKWIQVIR